jgi:hypothetical protein
MATEAEMDDEVIKRYHKKVKDMYYNDDQNIGCYLPPTYRPEDERHFKWVVWTILSIRDEVYAEG